MTIRELYRAMLEWAVEPMVITDNENASLENTLWQRSSRELADLPIGPEPVHAPPAFAPESDSRCA
ncbi:MAG: hypothetical protein P0Y66_11990 [Candidatus Kaistia colombiensis]|nr:MAG: hypothetical protein P0Y66_11990 [Kaistia sp.]